VPGGFYGFVRVEGSLAGGGFGPPGYAIDVGFEKKYAAFSCYAETCLEGSQEAYVDFAEAELADAHGLYLK
jgi:hypothetical protein